MKKRILLLLALVAIFAMLLNSGAIFEDIGEHRAEEIILKWAGYGIIGGANGRFRPDDPISRGEMAVILDRIMRYPKKTCGSFADLSGTEWYADAVLRLDAYGIMLGYGGRVRPVDKLTYEEAAVIACRAFGVAPVEAGNLAGAAGVSAWADGYVSALEGAGVIAARDSGQDLGRAITRAEAMELLDALCGVVYNPAMPGENLHRGNLLLRDSSRLDGLKIEGDLYIAPGVAEDVILHNVVVTGVIKNMSQRQVVLSGSAKGEVVVVDSTKGAGSSGGDDNRQYIDYFGQKLPVQAGVPVCSYSDAHFSKTGDRVSYANDGRKAAFGIDVSAWQKEIDWERVKADGVEFAMLRAGFRGYGSGSVNADQYFRANASSALAQGIDIGVYFFSQAITPQEAVEEAQFVLELIKDYNITYPVCFDWEMIKEDEARTDDLPVETVTACAVAFCQTIEAAGYTPAVYIYTETAHFCYDLAKIAAYDFWYAKYTDTPEFYYDFQMWQFSSGGAVAGVDGKVDMNLCFKQY